MLRVMLPTHSQLLLSLQGFFAWEERGDFKGLNAVELNLGFHLQGVILCKDTEGLPSSASPPLTYMFELCLFILTPGKRHSILFKYQLLQASTPAGTVRSFSPCVTRVCCQIKMQCCDLKGNFKALLRLPPSMVSISTVPVW